MGKLSRTDIATIERFVLAPASEKRKEFRQAAIDTYRANEGKVPLESSPHMRYMSEVDCLMPDYTLRYLYKNQIIAAKHKKV
jgi:hypothetical protein